MPIHRLLLLTLLFGGCSQPVKQPSSEPAAVATTARDSSLTATEQTKISRVDSEYQPILREIYALLDSHQPQKALSLLSRLPQNTANSALSNTRLQLKIRIILQSADLALKQHQARQALDLLNSIAPPATLAPQKQWTRLKIRAYEQTDNTLKVIENNIWLDQLLSPAEQQHHQEIIWEHLTRLTEPDLFTFYEAANSHTIKAWLLLAIQSELHPHYSAHRRAALLDWQQQYPEHAASDFASQLIASIPEYQPFVPQKIALLLPFNGKYQKAAIAIRDGILWAYYQDDTPAKPQLLFLNTGESSDSLSAYAAAEEAGAEFILGPLRKEAVHQLANHQGATLPIMALNHIDQPTLQSQFYQFGLSPEDEAYQIAERVWSDGHTQAAILTPGNALSKRLVTAFSSYLQELGGQVIATKTYQNRKNDHSLPIRRLLNIYASKYRHKKLEKIFAQPVSFHPRKRQDIDHVFMIASPKTARLLKPQLKFHHAAKLPVYATSKSYSGTPQREKDRDLNGVFFTSTPATLQLRQTADNDARNSQSQDLFHFGQDAYSLIQKLQDMQFTQLETSGKTGTLWMDEDRHIRRTLSWAKFVAGRPREIAPH